MSLVTFIAFNNASGGTLSMPASTAYPKRKLYGIYVGSEGFFNAMIITITNCVADTGATFTAMFGNSTSGAASGMGRGFSVPLPVSGLAVKTDLASVISFVTTAATTGTVIIDYENG